MTENELTSAGGVPAVPMTYPSPGGAATLGLRGEVLDWIRERGAMRFDDYMARVLYDPERGYYAKGVGQVGREGDFYTSVSVGPVFGQILARRLAFQRQGKGGGRLVEVGAHDGKLMEDVLRELVKLQALPEDVVIIEPRLNLAEAQGSRLRDAGFEVRVCRDLGDLKEDGMETWVYGNEVLDALPCRVIERRNGRWEELGVGLVDEDLGWVPMGELEEGELPRGLPDFEDGYRTEFRDGYRGFLEPLAKMIRRGGMIWIDYGFEREDYYMAGRSEGTLRSFSRHRAGDNPFAAPGEEDLTAHVDFTMVREILEDLGGCVTTWGAQGTVLTKWATEWLMEREGKVDDVTRREIRMFQTLIHPAHLGGKFRILEVEGFGAE